MKTLTKIVLALIFVLSNASTFASPVPTLTRQTLDGRIEVLQADLAGGRQVYTQAEWLAKGEALPGVPSSSSLMESVGGNVLHILGYLLAAWAGFAFLSSLGGKSSPKKVRA